MVSDRPPQYSYLCPSSGKARACNRLVWYDTRPGRLPPLAPTDLRASTSGVWRGGCMSLYRILQSNLMLHSDKFRFVNRSRSSVVSWYVHRDTSFRLVRLHGDLWLGTSRRILQRYHHSG